MIQYLRTFTFLAVLAAVAVCPGCLIGSHSHTNVTGRYVGPETLAQIQPGKSEAYVMALLGDPSEHPPVACGLPVPALPLERREAHVVRVCPSVGSAA